jgi:hypothetical protein
MSRFYQLWADAYSARQLRTLLSLCLVAAATAALGGEEIAGTINLGVVVPALAYGFVVAAGQRTREVVA